MRDTVFCLIDLSGIHEDAVVASVTAMVAAVTDYVQGYRLTQPVQVTPIAADLPVHTLVGDNPVTHQVSVFLEVEGAADYLPAYAGNLDIMTSAALAVGERMVARR
jgi:acetaldehyde dehydrogenase